MARWSYQSPSTRLPFSTQVAKRFVPTLVIWGVGTGALVSYLLSDVPIFKKDVLLKIPLLKQYYIDTTPDSDKPF